MFNRKKQNKLAPIEDQILLTPAHILSKQIKDGQLSSERVCQSIIERAKQVQPYINAITHDRFQEALEEARAIDALLERFRNSTTSTSSNSSSSSESGPENNDNADNNKSQKEPTPEELEMLKSPLLGIPVSIKESIGVRGLRNTCGLWTRKDHVSQEDAQVVKNLRSLGMIPFCVTNVPECTLYWADCQNKVYGRSMNPYDLSRITGASSGGEGSLLGAGGSLIGVGSDIGGSLRIPAHYCGVYSHKPSPFLVSHEGNYPPINEARMRMFSLGPMARYASDLRPLLKCLLQDKQNPLQDSYKLFQPANIKELREKLIDELDEHNRHAYDLSQAKLYYFNFNESSKLKGRQSLKCHEEFMEAQQEVLDHFVSKFSCECEELKEMDKYLKKTMITWQCMMRAGGCKMREQFYQERELERTFGIDNLFIELLKIPFGLSHHTKESLLAIMVGGVIPEERNKAYALCEKFEKYAEEMRQELEEILGSNGVLMMPTLPTVAYKHNEALLRTQDIRFTAIFNILQFPVTHATVRLDKKHSLPFGFSFATKPYNDAIGITMAEEIELAFGGWRQPASFAAKLATNSRDQPQDNTNTTNTTNQTNTTTTDPITMTNKQTNNAETNSK